MIDNLAFCGCQGAGADGEVLSFVVTEEVDGLAIGIAPLIGGNKAKRSKCGCQEVVMIR
jgi:hypothetical protein